MEQPAESAADTSALAAVGSSAASADAAEDAAPAPAGAAKDAATASAIAADDAAALHALSAARAAALAADLRILIGQLRRRLREQAQPGDLTSSQTAVLGRLERQGPATVTTLARLEGVRSQSMGAIIASLQEASLVAGAPDPTDRRQTILSLTPACRLMIEATRAAREDWLLRAIRTRLTPPEQDQLAAGVDLLKRLAKP